MLALVPSRDWGAMEDEEGSYTLKGSGELRVCVCVCGEGVMVNKDSPIFTMKQEMDVLNFTLQ